jgi:hypothetical protein
MLRNSRSSHVSFVGTRVANSMGRMRLLHLSVLLLGLTVAIINPAPAMATPSIVVSVPDQTLALINDGVVVAEK